MRRPLAPVAAAADGGARHRPGSLPPIAPAAPADSCPDRQRGGRARRGGNPAQLPRRARPALPQGDVEPRRRCGPLLAPVAASRLGHRLHPRGAAGRRGAPAGLAPDERPDLARPARLVHRPSALALPLHPEAGERAADRVAHLPSAPTKACAAHDDARLAAWAEGRTGWPFVDACMRMLRATGWLNFRMRAMVMSVAVLPALAGLAPGRPRARPPVHRLRARHPLAAGADAVRHHRHQQLAHLQPDQAGPGPRSGRQLHPPLVPGTRAVPLRWLHTPWLLPAIEQADAGCRLGRDYPLPLVDHAEAARTARDAIWAVRRRPRLRRHRRQDPGAPRQPPQRPAATGRAARQGETPGPAPARPGPLGRRGQPRPGPAAIQRRRPRRLVRPVVGHEHMPADRRRPTQRREPRAQGRVHVVRIDEIQRAAGRIGLRPVPRAPAGAPRPASAATPACAAGAPAGCCSPPGRARPSSARPTARSAGTAPPVRSPRTHRREIAGRPSGCAPPGSPLPSRRPRRSPPRCTRPAPGTAPRDSRAPRRRGRRQHAPAHSAAARPARAPPRQPR